MLYNSLYIHFFYIASCIAIGFYLGRYYRYRLKNYGVTKKMFLTLEKQDIDRRIGVALELKEYGVAWDLKRKMEKIEKKLKRVKAKEMAKEKQQKKNINHPVDGTNQF